MNHRHLITIALAGAGALTLSCSADQAEDRAHPTFHRDVEPLLQSRCQECHRIGGIAPMPLTSLEAVRAYAPAILSETRAKRMPPWGAFSTDECQPRLGFKDDLHLTDAELELLARWVDEGMNAGDEADAPPPATFATPGLAKPDLVLQPKNAFVASGGEDQIRCFVLDPGQAIPSFVSGIDFVPGNPEVVHHAILYVDPKREGPGRVGADGSYECFGGPGVRDTALLHAWAPGVRPLDLGSRLALPLPAGALLVLQVHYHPHGTVAAPDLSTVSLRFSETLPEYVALLGLIGNYRRTDRDGDGLQPDPTKPGVKPEFRIPPNAEQFPINMRFTLPAKAGDYVIPDLRVIGVGAHMHYVGTDLKFDIEHAVPQPDEPARECMLQTPRWDFNWQRAYFYDTSIETAPMFRPGDRLHLRCKYDNTMDNPFVVRALAEQGLTAPREVSLGETTLDEMCLAIVMAAFPNPLLKE